MISVTLHGAAEHLMFLALLAILALLIVGGPIVAYRMGRTEGADDASWEAARADEEAAARALREYARDVTGLEHLLLMRRADEIEGR